MELSTSSISNEIDKSIREEFSVSQAVIEEIRKRREKGQKPESISNEEIRKGDPILNTYKVLDDAIHGGMGSVWRVHHESWNVDRQSLNTGYVQQCDVKSFIIRC